MPTVRLPMPHEGQKAVQREARRFNWLSAGRRWRKTTLGMTLATEAAIAGSRILWGAPTYDQVRIGWNEMRQAAGGWVSFHIQRMTAEFPTGGEVIFRSLDDPDNARGHTADVVILDEVADIKPAAWYEVIRPMLIDTEGWLWAIGTPKGRNWFFREHRLALTRDDSACWQIPTVGCAISDGKLVRQPHPHENPEIPFREIQQIYDTTPITTFRQEILAEFIENEGVVFRNIAACVGAPLSPDPSEHKEHMVVCGVDWGKQADFTAISVGCVDCRVELARDRFNQIDYAFQRERLAVLCRRWHVKNMLAESNAMGEPILEQLQRSGLPVRGFATTATSKPPLIENLALAFEREEWQFQDDPVWTGELEAYERKVSGATGRSQYSAPEGMHDDTVMARALMMRVAMQPAGASLVAWV